MSCAVSILRSLHISRNKGDCFKEVLGTFACMLCEIR